MKAIKVPGRYYTRVIEVLVFQARTGILGREQSIGAICFWVNSSKMKLEQISYWFDYSLSNQ